ncbi:sugar transferase [uncultured Sphingomonas sp.]|uniref:sugar transferase n=1 Tax=uncultured Sphingomonas sp. TaxID=158754 RepID=UPI00260EAAAC|nr:sugar transferase [uncultured Sphingomonas sp.]
MTRQRAVEKAPANGLPNAISLNKRNIRGLLFIGLILCDIAAIRAGFSVGRMLRDWRWLAPNGIVLSWLILPIHLIFAARNGAISRIALERLSESIRRALAAFIMATSAVALLIFFQYAGPLVSRVAFGVAIVCSILFIALGRLIFAMCFVSPVPGGLVGELLIVDGVPPRPGAYHVFDAQAAGFRPDLNDPNMLARLAALVGPFDRVVVATIEERRRQWALLMKAYSVTAEVLLEGETPLGAIGVGRYHGRDTIVVARGPMSLGARTKKRTMDLVMASAAVVLLAPLLLLVAIAIKLDSRGPVLFAQTRLGRDNKPFKIMKFRSMKVQASDFDGNRSATPDDDRVTRVGRFIRKTSIDELPQLFNVLKGDMSIVGPRPHALGSLAGDKLFWEVTQKYWLRHTLKPGITGLAQIRGYRGATHEQSDLEKRLQADLEYIDGWRLSRDISIIANTIRVIVHPRAY